MTDKTTLEYAECLLSDLKFDRENNEEQTIGQKDLKSIEWLIEQSKRAAMYKSALIQISENQVDPVFFAISTLYETDQRFNKK